MRKEENTPRVEWAKSARKYLVSLVGALSIAASLGLIEGSAAKWIAVGIAFLTSAGIYRVPNKPRV